MQVTQETQAIAKAQIRLHLDECKACQDALEIPRTDRVHPPVSVVAHIMHLPVIITLRSEHTLHLGDITQLVRDVLDTRPTYSQLVEMVKNYYMLSGGNHYWEQKQDLDERAEQHLLLLGVDTEREG